MKIFTGIVLLVLVCACSDTENEIKDLRETESKVEHESSGYEKTSKKPDSIASKVDQIQENVPTSDWSYEVVLISENNWGYQLFQKGTMIINQTSIPSVQGVDGFDSQEKADRTAKHIINKLENGIFPPTVNKEELDSLDVLRD
jgi:hypothetical protein